MRISDQSSTPSQTQAQRWPQIQRLAPGIALAAVLGLLAYLLQMFEIALVGHELLEALVLAIFLGMAWRNLRGLDERLRPGVAFTSKQILEVSVVLLGASIDLPELLRAGPLLLVAIVATVCVGLVCSFSIGRLIGLRSRLAVLVAVGNSICGNSAIAAVAPVIEADSEDIASSIALTAVLGVVVVLVLPLSIPLLHWSLYQYGVFAGMTVYAVPQVLAATFSVSTLSGEVGTLVKLVRVLMLGPVVLAFSLLMSARGRGEKAAKLRLSRLVPWFISGFLVLGILRSVGALPTAMADPLREISRLLTIAAMAALGLEVDLRMLRRVGRPVAVTVLLSLMVLMACSAALIYGLHIAG